MAGEGVLTAADARGVWAWVAVGIDAAADLTETLEYAALPDRDRLEKASAAETAWLAGQWDNADAGRFALRYITEPGRPMRCVLLGRVQGPERDLTISAARRLRERMAALPKHVLGGEAGDAASVGGWLAPFQPHPAGLVDIRKRIRPGTPNRPDAGVAHYLVIEPFTVAAASWEPMWQAMAAHPERLLLDVALEPYAVPAELSRLLHALATQYGRLASPGAYHADLGSSGARYAPDAFAIDAARLFADAARRYAAHAFKLRVTLASPAPLPESLAELLGRTISPPERPTGESALTATFQGAAHCAVRPVGPAELEAAWTNIRTLDLLRWDAQYLSMLPVAVPPGLRLLAELADVREAAAALRLPLAAHGTMPGFPVRSPRIAGLTDFSTTGRAVELGRQLVGGRPTQPLGIGLDDLARHTVVVGAAGSGKTNDVLSLCEQLWRDHRVPFLVLEPANTTLDDYRWLATRPGLEDLLVFTVGNEAVAPLRLNPFEVPPGVRVGSHISGLVACFDAVYGLEDPLPELYTRAMRSAYARRGIFPTETSGQRHRGSWPTLADFAAEMVRETEDLEYAADQRANILAGSRLRVLALMEGACAGTLDCERSYPLERLLGRPVVIELAEVGDDEREQALLTALILHAVTGYAKAGRTTGGLEHVTVLEEAHRLLARPARGGDGSRADGYGDARARAARTLAATLADGHKYGEGLVFVEQLPGRLVEDAYKNSNLKIVHRLAAQDERALIGAAIRFSPDQERAAATLEPFTAFVHHDGLDRPALVRADDARTGSGRAPLADDTALAERFRVLASSDREVDAAIAPFPECQGCAHRCRFRSQAATAARPDHVDGLRARVGGYPTTRAARADWWQQTAEWVRVVSDEIPADAADVAARRDYEACVFVHLSRAAWRRDALTWNRLYREHVQGGP
ncbi:MAG TPA: DUF87 domain-containing protein [Actinocrinis sp.]|jgi:hypothetical protein|uniref:ATP-binding protein n=1 Tax=Actinocrinis sp. TaxID=1920516 RepID=UPI002DDCC029|nr:DUF87 domain-containing protein [Actinocrinis sp.]HEV3172740.1 DUF87 domain-containing protein [Actinocrinis sp.]